MEMFTLKEEQADTRINWQRQLKSLSTPNHAKVKLKVKVAVEQATKAQRGSRSVALLFL